MTDQAAPAVTSECTWPGCARPRKPAPATGRPSSYCEQPDEETGTVHNRTNRYAHSKREDAARQGRTVTDAELTQPHSMAFASAAQLAETVARAAADLRGASDKLTEALAGASDLEGAHVQVDKMRGKYEERALAAENAAQVAAERALRADEARQIAYDAADQVTEDLTAAREQVRELTDRLSVQGSEHAEQVRATAAQHRAELDRVNREAEQVKAAALADAGERVRAAEQAAAEEIAGVRDEATRQAVTAEQEIDRAWAKADTAAEDAASARQDAAAANARVQQIADETARVRDGYEQQLAALRGDAAREREQAAAQLTAAQEAATRERDQLLEQVTDLRGRAGQLTHELERERQAAAEGREQMRALYEGRVADLTAARAAEQEQAAGLRARLEEALAELRQRVADLTAARQAEQEQAEDAQAQLEEALAELRQLRESPEP